MIEWVTGDMLKELWKPQKTPISGDDLRNLIDRVSYRDANAVAGLVRFYRFFIV